MRVANFRGVMSADNSPAVSRLTKRKDEGFEFTLSQRSEGGIIPEVVRVNCFAHEDGTLRTVVYFLGEEVHEYITER